MTFLQPAGLWLLGLIPVVLLIHLLRANPRRALVPNAFLWRDLSRDLSASRRWQRPRLSWLLFLQLAAVAAVSLAVADPRMATTTPRHLLLLFDASASMLATDVGRSRFDEAVQRGRALIGTLGPQDRTTVIRVGATPTVVAEAADSATAISAMAGLRAGAGAAAMREALWLSSGIADRSPGAAPEAIVLSDGAFSGPGDLTGISMPVRFELVGNASDNQAVVALRAARQPGGSGSASIFARVANYSNRPTRVPVRLLGDGVIRETREVDVAARGRADLVFEAPEGSRRVAVALGVGDALRADDQAEIAVPISRSRTVIVVSRLPGVIERALGAIPELRVMSVPPESYSGESADLVVLDAFLPERLPRGQLLIVNPPAGRDYLPVQGELRSVQVTQFDPRHPLLHAVDLSATRLARSTILTPPNWVKTVAEAAGSPLILEGTESGRSVVVFAFDPVGSGLDRMLAFPLLVANAAAFLGGESVAPPLPGRSITIPLTPGTRDVRLESPDGSARALPIRDSSIVVEGLDQPGRYVLRERGDQSPEPRVFSINVMDEAESDLTPRQRASLPGPPRRSEPPSSSPTDIWPALVAVGLAATTLEWWRFGRGG